MRDRRIDAGIITIIPKEVEAVFNIFNINPDEFINLNKPFDYWESKIYSPLNNKDIRIIVTFLSGSAGNTESGITTAFFLRDWRPKIMCLVGIAAGVEGKVKIGDVIIPDKIHDVCVTVRKDGEDYPRGDVRHRDVLIERMLKIRPLSRDAFNNSIKAAITDLSEIERIAHSKNLNEIHFNDKFEIHGGSLISSNCLLRDAGYFPDVRKTKDEKCRGGEMEAAGFSRACEIENIPWLTIRGISDFGDDRKDDSFQNLAAMTATIALRDHLIDSIDFKQLPYNIMGENTEELLDTNLAIDLTEAYKQKRWDQTVTIGTFLSRPLWLSGKYELRRKFGKIIEDAAAKSKRNDERAKALIDDLGWTTYILKDTESAIKYIEDGLRIAHEVKNYFILTKGNRHLASIARTQGDYRSAFVKIDAAKNFCSKIEDKNQRKEMENSLLVSESKLLIAKGNYDEANKKLLIAKTNFKKNNDRERAVKVYNLLGKVHQKMGDSVKAIDYYTRGFNTAKKLGRKDEMITNSISIANFHRDEGNIEEAIKWYKIAINIASEINQINQSKELQKKVQELENR